jgi:hypothetical protein
MYGFMGDIVKNILYGVGPMVKNMCFLLEGHMFKYRGVKVRYVNLSRL